MTLEQKYENLRLEYRRTQRRLKDLLSEAAEVCDSYNGHRACDRWDEDSLPSREWVDKLRALGHKVERHTFKDRKRQRVRCKNHTKT